MFTQAKIVDGLYKGISLPIPDEVNTIELVVFDGEPDENGTYETLKETKYKRSSQLTGLTPESIIVNFTEEL